MRGWIVALTILGIAMASTGSLIGEHSNVATAIDRNDADFQEREAAGRFLVAADTIAAEGQVASALGDTADRSAASEETEEAETESEQPGTRGPVKIPSITDEEEPGPAKIEPAAAPAPVETAPRLDETAPAARAAPAAATRPIEPTASEPLAVVCMAGCGPRKVVYQAAPTPTRPEHSGGLIQAAVLPNEPATASVIACVAGCYGSTPRTYRAPELPRSRLAVIHGDMTFEQPWLRNESEGSGLLMPRGTRTRRTGE